LFWISLKLCRLCSHLHIEHGGSNRDPSTCFWLSLRIFDDHDTGTSGSLNHICTDGGGDCNSASTAGFEETNRACCACCLCRSCTDAADTVEEVKRRDASAALRLIPNNRIIRKTDALHKNAERERWYTMPLPFTY
jgi:hypothetical protein